MLTASHPYSTKPDHESKACTPMTTNISMQLLTMLWQPHLYFFVMYVISKNPTASFFFATALYWSTMTTMTPTYVSLLVGTNARSLKRRQSLGVLDQESVPNALICASSLRWAHSAGKTLRLHLPYPCRMVSWSPISASCWTMPYILTLHTSKHLQAWSLSSLKFFRRPCSSKYKWH